MMHLAAIVLALLMVGSGLRLITARHEARAERLARCQADVAAGRRDAPAAVEKLEHLFAGGSPMAACELAEALVAIKTLRGRP